ARRYGHRARRAGGCHGAETAAREAALRKRLSADDLRPAFDHHDAVPARGHDPEPAPTAGVPRGGRGAGRADRGGSRRDRRIEGSRDMTTAVEVPGVSAKDDGSSILVAEDVTMRFGGLVAVDSVDFQVHRGEIMGLIGPNGAGKTTFFNCLTGLYIPTEGRVVFDGAVLPPKPRKVVIAGIARTFQTIRLFGNMTALENVMVGRYCRTTTGPLTSILRGPKFRRDEKATKERAQELLDFVGLGHTTEHLARNLSYGDTPRSG